MRSKIGHSSRDLNAKNKSLRIALNSLLDDSFRPLHLFAMQLPYLQRSSVSEEVSRSKELR